MSAFVDGAAKGDTMGEKGKGDEMDDEGEDDEGVCEESGTDKGVIESKKSSSSSVDITDGAVEEETDGIDNIVTDVDVVCMDVVGKDDNDTDEVDVLNDLD